MDNIFLLLGTNVGDVEKNLHNALKALEDNRITIKKKSRPHRTKPWGYTDQPDFLNMAVEVACTCTPAELLTTIKQIETDMGREKAARRWGPRIIDIDIIFFGQQEIAEHNLIIPHPEFFNRPFAIKLLAEIAPEFVPPHSDKKLIELLEGVNCGECEIYCY